MTSPKKTSQVSRDKLLVECSRLYYESKESKTVIATRLSLSGMQVTRLLREAERRGIVQIHVKSIPNLETLADKLASTYKLVAAKVVEPSDEYEVLKVRLGEAAAMLLEAQISLRATPKVGVGGGSTIYETVERMPHKTRQISIYPMALVGRAPPISYYDSTYIATALYLKSRPMATAFVIGVPPLPRSIKAAQSFAKYLIKNIPEIGEVMEGAKSVDVAVVGLGGILPYDNVATLMARAGLGTEQLRRANAAGGINYNYYDAHGKQIGEFFLTVGVSDLRHLSSDSSRFIALVAGGAHKQQAIAIAVKTKMVNALVTDANTAMALLST